MMRSVSGTGSAGSRRTDPGGSGELSRFSVATTASSASGGGRGISFLDAFRACFVLPEARSPENSMSDESHPSHQLLQHVCCNNNIRLLLSFTINRTCATLRLSVLYGLIYLFVCLPSVTMWPCPSPIRAAILYANLYHKGLTSVKFAVSQSLSSQGSNSGSVFGSRRSIKGMYSPMHKSSLDREIPGSTKFSLPQIQKATKNFSPNFKIGQGGSGTVYKGQLADGTLVAVKRAKKNVYDKHMGREFWNEIETLQRIEHQNLVRFHGYLEFGGEQLIIVEYVPNGNLREHLDCINGKILEFSMRLEIAIDVAHAITYLHTYSDQPVIHRDIKSSNILLMNNCRAKVADFGFAKLAPTDASHISTQVKGTAGYLDPEYLRTYQLNEKSDVYSFGVLLVELVTGRRPIEPKRSIIERVTTKWAMEKFAEGNAIQTLDPNLEATDAINLAVEKLYELALQCLAPTKRSRPSMKRSVEILWSIRKDYRELVVPTSAMN